jgi:RNA polymerase sigma factor (sigma-70 family)
VTVDQLFAQHYDALVRYLVRVTGDGDLAADLAQEAFIRYVEKAPEDHNPKAWLFTVATNLARDDVRIRSRRLVLLSEVPDRAPMAAESPTVDEELESEERRDRVRRALDGMSERDRTLLLMREEGFSHEEMAVAAGTTTKSVGTMLARAFKKLAATLEQDLEITP